ncbi:MAG: hypothetical protein M1834_007634 [Cirrosporium novae-zelandiae]|nr:MAG: hypothetical protein M1834_007634 [Cirrosporium novae-zelandiae]
MANKMWYNGTIIECSIVQASPEARMEDFDGIAMYGNFWESHLQSLRQEELKWLPLVALRSPYNRIVDTTKSSAARPQYFGNIRSIRYSFPGICRQRPNKRGLFDFEYWAPATV